ncbi:hypothetical protein scyTo_0002976 [Scyliorhinus torazame]|uniref:Uncharacterized protein n=1 Tax=Scyliorhinus torazame TaxID=75743 RepID=A0A401PL77_SCYTO|nr:hypothetical protein [Scyliorhinus torazame]
MMGRLEGRNKVTITRNVTLIDRGTCYEVISEEEVTTQIGLDSPNPNNNNKNNNKSSDNQVKTWWTDLKEKWRNGLNDIACAPMLTRGPVWLVIRSEDKSKVKIALNNSLPWVHYREEWGLAIDWGHKTSRQIASTEGFIGIRGEKLKVSKLGLFYSEGWNVDMDKVKEIEKGMMRKIVELWHGRQKKDVINGWKGLATHPEDAEGEWILGPCKEQCVATGLSERVTSCDASERKYNCTECLHEEKMERYLVRQRVAGGFSQLEAYEGSIGKAYKFIGLLKES